MASTEHPIVRTVSVGGVAVTVRLPGSLRRFRPRSTYGEAPRELPLIEFPDEHPTFTAHRQDPEKWLDQWSAPPELWEQQAEVRSHGTATADGGPAAVEDEVRQLGWYHTIELPGGVVTPGLFDHRPLVPRYGFPESLAGQRAIDVATFDGFWAFELERRGADVTAIDLPAVADLDWPAGMRDGFVARGLDRDPSTGFRLAARALGSGVDLVKSSVYDLSPERVGQFDFAHIADVLMHLRDPVRALERVRSVVRDGGTAHIVDSIDPDLAGKHVASYEGGWQFCTWWIPSLDLLAQMVLDAGFSTVRLHRTFRANTADGPGRMRAILIATA